MSSSADNGPEHSIIYFNEYLNSGASVNPTYSRIAYAGIALNSAREWQQLSEISAYFRHGIVVEKLCNVGRFKNLNPKKENRGATNLLPEIAYALLTDAKLGAGATIGADAVDRDSMVIAANFCEANGFYWDGVMPAKVNLREWIFEMAGYCLLDFTIIGGRFGLIPSVPYDSKFKVANFGPAARVPIKALFTDGNIRALEVSFLDPEERQLFTAAMKYRIERKADATAEEFVRSFRFNNSEGGRDNDPIERFDMSAFCTSQYHASAFARNALKLRQLVDHGIKFETTPQAAMNLAPGEYFRLNSEATHTNRFSNGSIDDAGNINSTKKLSNNDEVYYWTVGSTSVQQAKIMIDSDGKSTNVRNCVFSRVVNSTVDRVYKVESLTYAEDGLVEISGSYAPLDENGELETVKWGNYQFVAEEVGGG